MQIPRSYIENYSNSLNQISATARESLSKALMQLNYDADIADIRNAVIAVMQTACGASSDLSARLAAEFYDGLRLQFGIDDGYQAEVDSGRIPEATDGAVRAFVQDLVDDKPIEQFVGKCVDRLDYETRKAANECIATNAKNDPEKPRWARVPTGVETCSFCIMLASRGFVYHSEETASHAHANCDCRVIPSWDKSPTAQGYDPDLYYDMWRHPEKYAEVKTEGEKQSLISRSFEKQPDIASAQAYAERFVDLNAYKAKIDLKGMDIDAANSLIKALDAVYDAYDVEPLKSIQRMNKRSREFKNSVAEASYRWMIGDLYYNADYVKTKKAMLAHRAEGEKLTADVLSGNLDAYIKKNAGNARKVAYAEALRDTQRALVAQSYDDFEELIYAHELGHMLDDRVFRKDKSFDRKASFEKYSSGISAYATTDAKEYVAESFTLFYAGDTESLDPELVGLFERSMK